MSFKEKFLAFKNNRPILFWFLICLIISGIVSGITLIIVVPIIIFVAGVLYSRKKTSFTLLKELGEKLSESELTDANNILYEFIKTNKTNIKKIVAAGKRLAEKDLNFEFYYGGKFDEVQNDPEGSTQNKIDFANLYASAMVLKSYGLGSPSMGWWGFEPTMEEPSI